MRIAGSQGSQFETLGASANYATYSYSLARGVTGVGAPLILPSGAPVPGGGPLLVSAPPGTEPTVADLLGACPTAGYAAEIYVAATMTNGIGRQGQYDAAALMGFVLTK